MNAPRIIFTAIGTIFLAAIIYVGIGAYKLRDICYKIVGFKTKGFWKGGSTTLNPIGADSYNLELSIRIRNPSYLDIILNKCNVTVLLGGDPVSEITTEALLSANGGVITIPKNNEHVVITIPIIIDLKGSSNLVRNQSLLTSLAAKQYSNVLITLQGSFSGFLLKIPINTSINISKNLQDIINQMKAPSDPNPDSCD